jgi:hypothetical protein
VLVTENVIEAKSRWSGCSDIILASQFRHLD